MASRLLKRSEIEFARQVFQDRLPYTKVHIASYYLPGNQGVPVTLASVSSIIPVVTLRHYTIYFGPEVFTEGADRAGIRDTFIHELTHVWQGYHSSLGWEYMVNSMISQGHAILTQGDRNRAYDYRPGKPWREYNVEQQALLVQHWYRDGMREDDQRFPYIANHIRAGRN
ncbi:MAG TPA: hypothetical protein VF591_03685 [Pyrinomonadaceae bacterium]|jgi:hypothetical protein